MADRWLDVRWARAAGVLTAASILLGWLAARSDTFPLDESVSRWINRWDGWYEPAGTLTNDYDIVIAVIAALLAIGLLAMRGRWDAILLFPLAALLRVSLSEFKTLVGRPRPTDLEVRDLVVEGSAFPSGHVMTATAIFGLWFILAPEIVPPRLVAPARLAAVAVIAVHAASRMWGGVHWLSDTYGAVIWTAAMLAWLMALRPAVRRVTARVRGRRAGTTDLDA